MSRWYPWIVFTVADQEAPTEGTGTRRIVAVYSGKGGVGRTMIAVNLACALAQDRSKVALVDLDLQYGDVGTMVEIAAEHATIIDIVSHEVAEIDMELVESAMVTGPAGVRILACPPGPELAEVVEANRESLHHVLELLRSNYDSVVVDGGRFMGEAGATLMDVADQILLVSTSTAVSLKNTRLTLGLLEALSVPDERIRLILNRSEDHTDFGPAEVADILSRKLTAVIPYDSKTAVTSIDAGDPFVLSQPKSAIAAAIRKLATELQREGAENPADRRGGLLGIVR
jgi:pilus assembly protein CpaE